LVAASSTGLSLSPGLQNFPQPKQPFSHFSQLQLPTNATASPRPVFHVLLLPGKRVHRAVMYVPMAVAQSPAYTALTWQWVYMWQHCNLKK
jgi:hypothetical protein